MTTSFFIVGEYNTAYAIAILVAVRLVTAERLTLVDGIFLAVIGLLAVRTYEAMIYLGPLLSLMLLWAIWRAPSRPWLPTALHLLAIAGFIGGMFVAIGSLARPYSEEHLDETIETATNFWQNLQFDLALAAALVVVVWALVRPRDLLSSKPYLWAGVFLAILALSPLLALSDTLVRPLAKSQYVARTCAGMIIATIVVFIWLYAIQAARPSCRPSSFSACPRRRDASWPSRWCWCWRSCPRTSTSRRPGCRISTSCARRSAATTA